jgi:hypothetical protein
MSFHHCPKVFNHMFSFSTWDRYALTHVPYVFCSMQLILEFYIPTFDSESCLVVYFIRYSLRTLTLLALDDQWSVIKIIWGCNTISLPFSFPFLCLLECLCQKVCSLLLFPMISHTHEKTCEKPAGYHNCAEHYLYLQKPVTCTCHMIYSTVFHHFVTVTRGYF